MVLSRAFVLGFFLTNLVLSSFYLDTSLNPNTTSRVLQVRSLHEEGSLSIDSHHYETIDKSKVKGHYYPDKAPLPVFLIYSIYNPLAKMGLLPEPAEDDDKSIFLLGSFITGSLCFTLIIMLLFNKLVANGFSIKLASLLSTLPLYGSMFFVYAGTFYAHIMVVLFILMSLEFLQQDKNYFLAGLFAGAAFLSEYLTAVIAFVFFFQILYNASVKKALYFGLGTLPFILSFFAYNYLTTGHILETLYAHQVYYDLENGGFTWPSLVSLGQMLFSPWRGIVFYAPIVLLFIPLLKNLREFKVKDFLSNYTILPVILYFITLSAFTEWPGGWTYGPRYLMPALGIMIYAGLSNLTESTLNRFLLAFSMSLGIIHAFSAKLTIQYSIPSTVKFPFIQNIILNVIDGHFNNQSLFTHAFGLSAQQSAFIFLGLFSGAVIVLMTQARKLDSVQ